MEIPHDARLGVRERDAFLTILDMIEANPKMFFEEASFKCLSAFIGGYYFACEAHRQPHWLHWLEFEHFVARKLGLIATDYAKTIGIPSCIESIQEASGGDDQVAFQSFFTLLREFRASGKYEGA